MDGDGGAIHKEAESDGSHLIVSDHCSGRKVAPIHGHCRPIHE
jgi:hypothetical protein